MNWKSVIIIALTTLAFGLVLGYVLFKDNEKVANDTTLHEHTGEEVWTCSMHPQIRREEPGKCPICGMDLIPIGNVDAPSQSDGLTLSDNAVKLANIQTVRVGSNGGTKQLRLNGTVKADERKIYSQVAHIGGRVESLQVNFTGEYVKRGQQVATLYAPELVTAKQELMQAYKLRDSQPDLYQAARTKLKNWKLSENAIDKMISSGGTQERSSVVADVSGIVVAKRVNLGDYVERGAPLYDVADLSSVWVLFDVYEDDLPWVKVNDVISFTVQSLPGQTFSGKISFVDPLLDPSTRAATARVEVPNAKGILKPEMFVAGNLKSDGSTTSSSLTIPKSAVLWTGERSVVYVRDAANQFHFREITLGSEVGDSYVVSKGLTSGEEVVVNGTFAVDAAAQLAGKQSMMNRPIEQQSASSTNDKKVAVLIQKYLLVKDAFVADDLTNVKSSTNNMLMQFKTISMHDFSSAQHTEWMKHQQAIESSLVAIEKAKTLEEARLPFKTLSDKIIALAELAGPPANSLYVLHCPMADSNNGADWLSSEKEIKNPYFGKAMERCGEVKRSF